MIIKIFLVAALVAAGMVAIKDGALKRFGLVGGCVSVSVSNGGDYSYLACTSGRLAGYPDLTKQSCMYLGVNGGRDLWRCPAPVVASQTRAT
jgi:hypothetical protein